MGNSLDENMKKTCSSTYKCLKTDVAQKERINIVLENASEGVILREGAIF
jgi:hypothetical protein